MAGTDARDLYALADELLAACVEALDTIPTFAPGLGGSPERSYVSPGEPAADCCDPGQLTVHIVQGQEMPTEPLGLPVQKRAAHHIRLNTINLLVTIFRCVPGPDDSKLTVEPPTPEALEGAAEQLNADIWALWNHLFNMIGAGELLTRCSSVNMEGFRSLPPSGGCGGWVLAITAKLDGYEEVSSS